MSSRSPPPLQHPKPTHPAYPPPEPPKTPGGSTNSSPYSQAQRISSDGGYQRYSSPPVDGSAYTGASSASASGATSTSGFSAYAPPSAGNGHGHGPGPPAQQIHSRTGYGGPAAQAQGYGAQAQPHSQGQPFGGWQMNDATTQMGMQFGKSAVAAGQDYVEKNVSRASDHSTRRTPGHPVTGTV